MKQRAHFGSRHYAATKARHRVYAAASPHSKVLRRLIKIPSKKSTYDRDDDHSSTLGRFTPPWMMAQEALFGRLLYGTMVIHDILPIT